jgi:hypothetical protein
MPRYSNLITSLWWSNNTKNRQTWGLLNLLYLGLNQNIHTVSCFSNRTQFLQNLSNKNTTCQLSLLQYTSIKGCYYNYNWPFQKTIILGVADPNMKYCCLDKRNKVSCVKLDELLQMLIRNVLILPNQHWQGHKPLTPCSDIHAKHKPLCRFSWYW